MSSYVRPGTVGTGDSISPTQIGYFFLAPADLWIEELIFGMLWDLTQAYRFTQVGAVTPEQAAEVFTNIWEGLNVATQVGTIITYAGLALPANALPCDGASYLRADYPALFAILGVLWGSADSAHFNVPDLQGRAGIGAGHGTGLSPRSITDQGGEETHVLTVSELASHSHTDAGHAHTYGGTLLTSTVVPPPVDGLSPNPFPVSTGTGNANIQNTGGDQGHNTMMPFTVVNYGIIYT